jgi:hypothetical protein
VKGRLAATTAQLAFVAPVDVDSVGLVAKRRDKPISSIQATGSGRRFATVGKFAKLALELALEPAFSNPEMSLKSVFDSSAA